MITKRDLEIFKFINKYGKTYLPVLEKTFFTSPSSAKNRIVNLKNSGLISYWNTKLASPKKAIVISKETKDYFENELDIKVKLPTMNMSTIHHNIIEQIVDFHLSIIGTVERTTVANDHSKMHHVPDFIFYPNGSKMKVNVEVETSKKTSKRYAEIFLSTKKDGVDSLLYIFPKHSDIERYATFMPIDSRLRFIDIETLIFNIKNQQKIKAISQDDIRIKA